MYEVEWGNHKFITSVAYADHVIRHSLWSVANYLMFFLLGPWADVYRKENTLPEFQSWMHGDKKCVIFYSFCCLIRFSDLLFFNTSLQCAYQYLCSKCIVIASCWYISKCHSDNDVPIIKICFGYILPNQIVAWDKSNLTLVVTYLVFVSDCVFWGTFFCHITL